MIQLLEIQKGLFKLKINNIDCEFRPMELFVCDRFMPLTRHVRKDRAILYWVVGGKQVSYNQIKKAIKDAIQNNNGIGKY